jgi:hypothetical protein
MQNDINDVVYPVLRELSEAVERMGCLMRIVDIENGDARVLGDYYTLQVEFMERLEKAAEAVRVLYVNDLAPFVRDMKLVRLA